MLEWWLRDKCLLVDLDTKTGFSWHRVAKRGVALLWQNLKTSQSQALDGLNSRGRAKMRFLTMVDSRMRSLGKTVVSHCECMLSSLKLSS